ncbi:MAG: NUDIX hydrolase [Chitinispirillales bacterium]|nr:NUDIX hydrolase [Chitinispirillales bacterium]
MDEYQIRSWKETVESAGCSVESSEPIAVIRRKNGAFLFALLHTSVVAPEGYKLPNILFVRGDACIVVPLLRNRDSGEERFLMVRQRRIGNGQMSLEFPAGMLDQNSDAAGTAVREMDEETGLAVKEGDLFPLCETKLYSSAGASDEAVFYFGCIIEVDDAQFQSFTNRKTGCASENEHISTVLMTRAEAEKQSTSLQARLGFFLFEDYMKKHDISK